MSAYPFSIFRLKIFIQFSAEFRLNMLLNHSVGHFRFRMYWGINYKCLVSRWSCCNFGARLGNKSWYNTHKMLLESNTRLALFCCHLVGFTVYTKEKFYTS